MGNTYNMSTIIRNKLVLHVLFSKKYQINFFFINMHILKKILVVNKSDNHIETYINIHHSGTYKSG